MLCMLCLINPESFTFQIISNQWSPIIQYFPAFHSNPKFRKFHAKTTVLESLFNEAARAEGLKPY